MDPMLVTFAYASLIVFAFVRRRCWRSPARVAGDDSSGDSYALLAASFLPWCFWRSADGSAALAVSLFMASPLC
jgi:hypothetical protein